MVLPIKAEVPRVPENCQVRASGSPTACHEDVGNDEVSQGSQRLLMLEIDVIAPRFQQSWDSSVDCPHQSHVFARARR